jgi:hypothetical protein
MHDYGVSAKDRLRAVDIGRFARFPVAEVINAASF